MLQVRVGRKINFRPTRLARVWERGVPPWRRPLWVLHRHQLSQRWKYLRVEKSIFDQHQLRGLQYQNSRRPDTTPDAPQNLQFFSCKPRRQESHNHAIPCIRPVVCSKFPAHSCPPGATPGQSLRSPRQRIKMCHPNAAHVARSQQATPGVCSHRVAQPLPPAQLRPPEPPPARYRAHRRRHIPRKPQGSRSFPSAQPQKRQSLAAARQAPHRSR